MKKYPVHYKGKEYEVRWGEKYYRSVLGIFEVKKISIFKKFRIKKYKSKFNAYEDEIIDKVESKGILKSHPNFYIEEIKMLFYLWERRIEEENKRDELNLVKEQVLENWDGIIE
jgi:hypothetical protein